MPEKNFFPKVAYVKTPYYVCTSNRDSISSQENPQLTLSIVPNSRETPSHLFSAVTDLIKSFLVSSVMAVSNDYELSSELTF